MLCEIMKLRNKIQEIEPQKNEYAFKHTYDAATQIYNKCFRIINEALCQYCVDKGHCEWFCNGKCFCSIDKSEI